LFSFDLKRLKYLYTPTAALPFIPFTVRPRFWNKEQSPFEIRSIKTINFNKLVLTQSQSLRFQVQIQLQVRIEAKQQREILTPAVIFSTKDN